MLRRLGMVLTALLIPSSGWAADAPERLLPASTQVYLRWDGVAAHRAAYAKTALGQTLQGDTGKFLTTLLGDLRGNLDTMLTVPQLLGGAAPDRLQRIQADAKEVPRLAEIVFQNGLVIGVELRSLQPPSAQLTVVLPNAGAEPGPFLSAFRLAALLNKVDIKETKAAGRTLYQIDQGPVQVVWWLEGKDAVLAVGTERPDAIVKWLTGQNPRLLSNPLFQRVQAFKEYETSTRGFVDVAALTRIIRTQSKEAAQLIDDLGLAGLQSLTFHSGFDGDAERSLVQIHMPGPRKGILKLTGGKPFQWSELPALPPDLINFMATKLNYGAVYDAGLETAEAMVRVTSPGDLPKVKQAIQQADLALGIDLRKDLIGALGDMFVLYSSPAEGPLTFGQTYLFKVKDAKKLRAALDQAIKALGTLTGIELRVTKAEYHGATLHSVRVRSQGFFFIPSYAIHKDWLAVSFYPQAVQGYILRANGELPTYQPGPRVKESLGKLPQEFLFVSVSDPVPTIKQVLSLAPLVGSAINSNTPTPVFDVGSLPNAHEATRYLFPNVLVATGDAQTLRLETRTSLMLPFELSGLDSYTFVIFLFFVARIGA